MLVRVAARLLAQRRLVPTVSNVNSLPIRTLVPQRSFAAAAVTKTTRATKGATKPRAKSTAKPKTTKAKAKAKPKKKTSIKAEAKPKKRATRAKKTKTPEQIAAAAKKTRLTQIRELRATALKAPHSLPSTAYLVVCSELGKEVKTVAGKEAAAKYKNLIPDELEHYNRIANQNKSKNESAYKAWVQSHTPEEIRRANVARKHLKRLGVKGYNSSINDNRQVKRPANALNLFLKERYSTGDMHGMSLTDAARIIAREWRELPTSEKQKYYASELASREQYKKDVKKVYHRDIEIHPIKAAAAVSP